jgi:hypothetical protein
VYPGQTFYLDGTQSSRPGGVITGYIFGVGEDPMRLHVRDPLLPYEIDAEGDYEVSLQLLGGQSIEFATVSVVPCDQYLACDPPRRPCPPSYTCNSQKLCTPAVTTCATSAECPADLICRDGACGYGGSVCADIPGPRPIPDPDPNPNPDPDPDPNPTLCNTHEDCPENAFCVPNDAGVSACERAVCDADCLQQRLLRTELLNVPEGATQITGFADSPTDRSARFALSLDGDLWRYTDEITPGISDEVPRERRPTATPPSFSGTVRMARERTRLQDTFPSHNNWLSLDLTFSPDGGEADAVYLTNFDAFWPAAPLPAFDPFAIDLLLSFLGPNVPLGERGDWSIETPFMINSNSLGNVTAYELSGGEVQFYDLSSGNEEPISIFYNPLPGAAICAIALRNNDIIYLAENRVVGLNDNDPRFTAARIIAIDPRLGVIVDAWYSPIGPTCALEATSEGLLSVGLSVLAPFTALYQ